MLKIKDLKSSQFFWYMPDHWLPGEKELLRVWSEPVLVNGIWVVEATCAGDYCYTLDEPDEKFMFKEHEMDY